MISRWLPLVLLVAPAPRRCGAVQLGATLDVGTGPATWDQVETDGARTQGTLGACYRPARVLGLQPELSGDFGLSTERPVRTALRWDVMGRLHTRGEVHRRVAGRRPRRRRHGQADRRRSRASRAGSGAVWARPASESGSRVRASA